MNSTLPLTMAGFFVIIPHVVLSMKGNGMDQECARCSMIIKTEMQIRSDARRLKRRVLELCRPVRTLNNEALKAFQEKCSGMFGWWHRRHSPKLITEPYFRKELWFLDGLTSIEDRAHALEVAKMEDAFHWRDEQVVGRRTGIETTRLECYKKGDEPRLPLAYDFTSREGTMKLLEGRLVICEDDKDKKVVPIEECVLTDWGGYILKKFAMTQT